MHLNDDDLVLHYYGELDDTAEARATEHLAACGACHDSYTRLQRVLAAVDAAPAPVLPDGFERTVWARLEPNLPARRSWTSWLAWSPGHLAWAAAVLILVAGAFFAGRVSREEDASRQAEASSDLRERVLLADLGEHLERSEAVLIEVVSAGGSGSVDISSERERAGDLVAANRLYRQSASANGDTAVAELLDELERVLVELAASPDDLSAEEIEGVRQRIDARNLLFKVRVVSSGLRERQQQQIRIRTGQSS